MLFKQQIMQYYDINSTAQDIPVIFLSNKLSEVTAAMNIGLCFSDMLIRYIL